MKEKLKTALIIILLIISLILIIGCRSKYTLFLPGYSPKSISIIRHDRLLAKECDKQFEEQLLIDSIFYDRYEFPLTR